MRIIYADDAPDLLRSVAAYFRQHGHDLKTLETDNLLRFQERLSEMLEEGFKPQALILGGHNVLRDTQKDPLMDLDAFSLYGWLQEPEGAGLLTECPVVLFSRDEELRQQALDHPEWGLHVVVAKDEADALPNLLSTVEGLIADDRR